MAVDASAEDGDHTGILICSVSVEKQNPLGGINGIPVVHKKCQLRLGRNEFQEMLIRLETAPKPTQTFLLHNFQIFAKFLKEGKATIKFKDAAMQLMISNCPPDKLSDFLKTISVKITCMRKEGRVTAQAVKKKLASDRNPVFQLISPLNAKNASVMERVIKGKESAEKKRRPDDTPSPVAAKKRKTGKPFERGLDDMVRKPCRVGKRLWIGRRIVDRNKNYALGEFFCYVCHRIEKAGY